jgi:membrane peptidoglycan carboxypeptidase
LGGVTSLILLVVIFLGGAAYANLTYDLPGTVTLEAMMNPQSGILLQPTRFYDRSGQILLLSLDNPGIPRRFLPLDPAQAEHLSPQLVQTAIALLEPGFWQSPGFSTSVSASSEPATIAERLVGDLLLSSEPQGLRKGIRTKLLAAQVVAQYGRAQVLEWYLNSASFGHQAYGVDAAARLYLDKPASGLDFAESAVILAALEAPALNPLDAPVAAREEQQDVLGRLLARGIFSSDDYARIKDTPVHFRESLPESDQPARAFTRLAREQAIRLLGEQRVLRGGLQIITTLDLNLQNQAACTALEQVQRASGKQVTDSSACDAARLLPTLSFDTQPAGTDVAASVLLVDPKLGQVLALVGETSDQGETTSSGMHAPGSLLSPFVALAGFARGLGPASLVWDIPSGQAEEAGRQATYHGPQRLRLALANDYLAAVNQLLNQLGPVNVWRLAEPLGLEGLSESPQAADLLSEGGSLSLLDVAQAYSTFSNLGEVHGRRLSAGSKLQPTALLSIADENGNILLDEYATETQLVLSAPLAYLLHNVLADEPARWPSQGYPNPLEIGRPAGAKTGQTYDGRSTWTVGYTPDRLSVVWVGYISDREEKPALSTKLAAGIWHAVMQYATRDFPSGGWDMPAGITTLEVCDPSGQLPTVDCPERASEIFLTGNEPLSADSLYQRYQVNRETGRLATVFTPAELVEEKIYMVVPPEARQWALSAGIALPPSDYDLIQAPPPSKDVHFTSPEAFAYVRGQVTLRGTAAGEGFASYRVQVGQGINPRDWLQIGDEGTRAVNEGTLGTWDTRGLDGLYALRLQVVNQDYQVESAVLQVSVDNIPPEARVIYPATGQVFHLPDDRLINLLAEVKDGVGISRVQWTLDGRQIGERTQPPFSLEWQAVEGEHVLVVRAFDLAENETKSEAVRFIVNGK